MKELFSDGETKNNEEYKKVIKVRMNMVIIFFLIGILWLATAVFAINVWKVGTVYRIYIGLGSWLTGVSAINWVRYKLMLTDDKKIKNERLNRTDERNRDIRNKAFRVAGIVLLIILYAVGLIGGLFNPILVELLLALHIAFPISYLVAYKIYKNRM